MLLVTIIKKLSTGMLVEDTQLLDTLKEARSIEGFKSIESYYRFNQAQIKFIKSMLIFIDKDSAVQILNYYIEMLHSYKDGGNDNAN